MLLTLMVRCASVADTAIGLLMVTAASGLVLGMNALVHLIYYRPRPFVAEGFIPLIRHSQESSFFSSHMSVAGAIALSVWMLDRRAGVVAAILCLIMAVGRAASGLHYPSDLLVGLVLGGGSSLLIRKVSGRYVSGNRLREARAFGHR